ncbi:hypothetical protein [Glaciihabitans sp. dw_435]|uniref:hypothetical protein n=1 Tax=Glaciihabitans sp. dw_435 TaxID=2720081 RepID=UPI001BD21011|nr:hypothetical protein [Glaciihabitans sp. dw_435]
MTVDLADLTLAERLSLLIGFRPESGRMNRGFGATAGRPLVMVEGALTLIELVDGGFIEVEADATDDVPPEPQTRALEVVPPHPVLAFAHEYISRQDPARPVEWYFSRIGLRQDPGRRRVELGLALDPRGRNLSQDGITLVRANRARIDAFVFDDTVHIDSVSDQDCVLAAALDTADARLRAFPGLAWKRRPHVLVRMSLLSARATESVPADHGRNLVLVALKSSNLSAQD